MSDFIDEFDNSIMPVKPQTPTEYTKLEDANLIKRDIDTFPDFLKDEAFDKYKLISIVEKEISGGWTQKNIEPILAKLFKESNTKKPNWRTVVRWRKAYIDSNGELSSLVVKQHKMGNRTKRI